MMHGLCIAVVVLCVGLLTVSAQPVQCPYGAPSRLEMGDQARTLVGSNLRSRPSPDSTLLNIIPAGTLVPIAEDAFCSQGFAWYPTVYRGERGWIAEGTTDGYWLEPYQIAQAQLGTIRAEALPELGITLSAERADDAVLFTLRAYPVRSAALDPVIQVYETLPTDADVARASRILTTGTLANEMIPAAALAFPDRNMIRYLTLIVVGQRLEVVYSARRLTPEGAYVRANLPIRAPDVPAAIPPGQTLAQTIAQALTALDALPPEAFTPSLALLDGLVQSVTTTADSIEP